MNKKRICRSLSSPWPNVSGNIIFLVVSCREMSTLVSITYSIFLDEVTSTIFFSNVSVLPSVVVGLVFVLLLSNVGRILFFLGWT